MSDGEVLLKATGAVIKTCTVTIQVLKIDKRQLTHSVFRQLPREVLFDEQTVEIAEDVVIWGWVNYTPSGEEEKSKQFIVQKGERLVRCPFWVRKLTKERWTWPSLLTRSIKPAQCDAGLYLLAKALEGTLVYNEEMGVRAKHQCYWVDLGFPFGCERFVPSSDGILKPEYAVLIEKAIKPVPSTRWDEGKRTQVQVPLDEIRETGRCELRKLIVTLATGPGGHQNDPAIFTPAFWRSRIDKRVSAAADYIKEWNSGMDKLATTEQLYIAT